MRLGEFLGEKHEQGAKVNAYFGTTAKNYYAQKMKQKYGSSDADKAAKEAAGNGASTEDIGSIGGRRLAETPAKNIPDVPAEPESPSTDE